ncbi:MAG: inorganic phosphate transporter [Clostridia bacterium]|nr:inorganic phosphate transporter [Clostridia bacterium]
MILLFTVLILCVILVNGFTDAPNAIAGCISTHSLSPRAALLLAAVCNLVGAVGMAFLNPGVAQTLFGIADFGEDSGGAMIALCAGLCAVILWALLAWRFGIPTSESHALISGITGAAVARRMSLSAIQPEEWGRVFLGLFATTAPAFLLGVIFSQILFRVLSRGKRRPIMKHFMRAQRFSAASSALLHGAQDSQKFMGVYMLGLSLQAENQSVPETIPLSIVLICSLTMTLGTLFGGSKIIKKVGCELTDLDAASGSASDAASSAVLTVCSFLGIPASTTHSKACALMGTGFRKRRGVDPRIASQLLIAWVLTFPACGAIGFFLSYLFSHLPWV